MALAAAGEPAAIDSVAAVPPPARVRAWQTGLARPDRLQHLSLSFTLAVAGGTASRAPAAAAGGAFLLGIAKEWRDRGTSGFDVTDLLADALGAAGGAFVADALVREPQR